MSEPLLVAEQLSVRFGQTRVLTNVNLQVRVGETLAIVGESGSGKTTLLRAMLGLLSRDAVVSANRFEFQGRSLLAPSESPVWDSLRGRELALVSQDPGKAWNPTRRVGAQFEDVLRGRVGLSKKDSDLEASRLLERVNLSRDALTRYPHELSGGMRQRAMIALSLCQNPKVLLTDEPTTALDVTLQAQILVLLKDLQRDRNLTWILVTHDLGVVAQVADRVALFREGEKVEDGHTKAIFREPAHPYTRSLLEAVQ